MRQKVGRILALGALLLLIQTTSSLAGRGDGDGLATAAICEQAARRAAATRGVPLDVMRAISLTETGRKTAGRLTPWPWTVNMEGAGKWFDTRREAEAYVARHYARGARSFDVGCFQINYRWHGAAFDNYAAMFDPQTNADYAADFLKTLFAETGDWSRAAGAYHSRTPKFAKRYRARFDRLRAALGPMLTADPAPAIARQARAPLKGVAIATPGESAGSLFRGADPVAGLLRPARPLFGD